MRLADALEPGPDRPPPSRAANAQCGQSTTAAARRQGPIGAVQNQPADPENRRVPFMSESGSPGPAPNM